MAVQLNHTIVWCRDQAKSAGFLSHILDLPEPRRFMHFHVVDLSNGVSLDYMAKDGPIALQHLAFLVEDDAFDATLARIREATPQIWADPARTKPGEVNHHFGGRGVYFQDPDGHLLEVITKPYAT